MIVHHFLGDCGIVVVDGYGCYAGDCASFPG